MDKLTKETIKNFTSKEPKNLKDFNMSLGLLIPRADLQLSHYSLTNNLTIEKCIDIFYKDGLNAYLKKMNHHNLLGEFGEVTNPISYICRFKNLKIDYHWIPKNACTFFKKNLAMLDLEAGGIEQRLETPQDEFHETIQKKYGLVMKDYLKDNKNKKLTIIREPTERLVSCYIDKFAKPCIKNQSFEPYIKDIINNIYSFFSIKATPEERSISFSEFLAYIKMMPNFSSNEHWRPQADFIKGIKFDYVFRQEKLMEQAKKHNLLHKSIESRLNSSVGLSYNKGAFDGELSNILPKKIELDRIEDYSQFVTSTEQKIINILYSKDIEIYKNAI